MEGKVELPLEAYHKLRNKIKEAEQEAAEIAEDSQEITDFAKQVREASDHVADFLSMLYKQNSQYIEDKIREFNNSIDQNIFVVDRNNKKITIRLSDEG